MGSTSICQRKTQWIWDHPRIRGEHDHLKKGLIHNPESFPHTRGALAMGNLQLILMGSSSHTRGALGDEVNTIGENGIIPAYAGSTYQYRPSVVRKWDHPRIRGEHASSMVSAPQIQGSSPHTRGARDRLEIVTDRPRIIPAYAGSTQHEHIFFRS